MLFAFDFLSGVRRRRLGSLDRVRRRLTELAADSDARLREHSDALRLRLTDEGFTAEAVALAAESIRRTHGLGAYDVQLRAGLALAEGALVEMATGEGKTLAALLPA